MFVTARNHNRIDVLGTRVFDERPGLMQADPGLYLPEPLPFVFTEYDVTPTEVLKAYSPVDGRAVPFVEPGTVLRVVSPGGVAQFNGVIVDHEMITPRLVEGRQYLLFLKFSKSIHELRFDTFDVFDITGTTVTANRHLSAAPHGKELIGLSPRQALRKVRTILDSLQQ